MVDVHRFHDISESNHLVLNPLSDAKVDLLGEILDLGAGDDMLDLACGRGEMLCRYAAKYGNAGTGVDIHEPLLDKARARAAELGVEGRVQFVLGEAAEHARTTERRYRVAMCIGATWIGDGLAGTLELMRPRVVEAGWLLVGEVYSMPPGKSDRQDLPRILDIVEAAGLELVEMVLASPDDWDRYAASQWLNVARWLDENPDDPDAEAIRTEMAGSKRDYLADGRDHLGWGVFVLRVMP